MKANSKTQMDQGLGFDGAGQESTGKVRGGLHVNAWSGHMNDGRLVNKGRGPTVGNQDHAAMKVGPAATKDAYRAAPTSAMPASVKIKNPDYINGGGQVRNPGGTRDWQPQAGQNYKGNPDSIRVGQAGGTGYGAATRGSRPVAPGSTGGINYGPKKQY